MSSGIKQSIIAGVSLLNFLIAPLGAHGAGLFMRGPPEKKLLLNSDQTIETSCVTLAFKGAIRLYQKRVSPIGGVDRCGFRPSCSAYGYQAICEQGPWVGMMMIGDRLTRCNMWKEPGPDYTLLPNGKLYDPPTKNLLFQPTR